MKKRLAVLPLVGLWLVAACQAATVNPNPHDDRSARAIDWPEALGALFPGPTPPVAEVDARPVTLKLQDGRIVVTTEPRRNEGDQLIQRCGSLCANISITTE